MGIDLQPCDWHIDRKDVRYRNLGKFLCYFIREYGIEDKRRKLYDELKIAYMFRILDHGDLNGGFNRRVSRP